jgi:glycosyltransferase involved in cell wall biosynthesis
MKIVIVSHDADFSGAPRIAFDIASALVNDHDVALISKREGPLIGVDKYANLRANYMVTKTSHTYGSIAFNERVRQAIGILDRQKPALVYANSTGSCEWCVAARRLGVPTVLHTHEMAQGLKGLSAADVLKFDIPRYIDLLISASQEATDDFMRFTSGEIKRHFLFGIAIEIAYVQKLADEPVARPRSISGRELSRDRPVITMCGTATVRKGIDLFYEAAKQIPSAEFLWIGPFSSEDPVAARVMAQYKSERTDNFFTTGETANPYAYMSMSDIFALTSIEDPNPLVVAEALALGKRVLSFQDTGGSWRWTRSFGYLLSGAVRTDRLVAFLRKMLKERASPTWIEAQATALYDAVDMDRKLPLLRQQLSEVVGAPV